MGNSLSLSGEKFCAVYQLSGKIDDVKKRADDICIEQTVEYPQDLIVRKDIREQIFGKIISIKSIDENLHQVNIEYAVEIAGGELTQFVNVLFGNISLKPGIKLVDIILPGSITDLFKGPRFGREGLRGIVHANERPILCTAVKPMGLSPKELAELAGVFCVGGVDIIKDDHGLADQSFCRFDERVKRCAEAVNNTNEKTGGQCIYFPNITAPAHQIFDRIKTAKEAGVGGLLIAPGLVGLDTMRMIARDDTIGLPVMSHPAFQGSFGVHPDAGLSLGVLYGILCRLAGADASIFPSFGGRFSFSQDECRQIVDGCNKPINELAPIFPVPAGGMTLERIPSMREFYGNDVIFLIGGDLHRHGDLRAGLKKFTSLIKGTATNE